MVRDPKKVRQNLLKKGFIEKQGTKHILYKFEPYGIMTEIQTKMSRNDQDLNDYLLDQMKKQLYLDKKDFFDFIDCPLSEADYIKILKNKNILKD